MIAIPNMEIPKTCGECELRALDEWEDEYCVILVDDILVPYERMLDCPLIDIVTCGECRHKPIKYDPEGDDFGFNLVSPNGYDNLCPCLNTDDGFYSYMPENDFFCAFGERRADDHI